MANISAIPEAAQKREVSLEQKPSDAGFPLTKAGARTRVSGRSMYEWVRVWRQGRVCGALALPHWAGICSGVQCPEFPRGQMTRAPPPRGLCPPGVIDKKQRNTDSEFRISRTPRVGMKAKMMMPEKWAGWCGGGGGGGGG